MQATILLTVVLSAGLAVDSPSPPQEVGILIVQKTVNEAHTPVGLQKSQALVEFQLLGDVARQDTYLGGVKGDSRTHTTMLYFPEQKQTVSILHANNHCTIMGEATLEEQKRLLRENLAGRIPTERPKLTPTGEVEQIEGRDALKYTAESPTTSFMYWIVEDEQLVAAGKLHQKLISTPGGELGALQFPDPATFPGYPVRMVLTQDHGPVKVDTEITTQIHFDVRMDPSIFEVPEGCEVHD